MGKSNNNFQINMIDVIAYSGCLQQNTERGGR